MPQGTVLLSAEIRASALQMSKFRGSITFPVFSLSTLSRLHYCTPPKTRYCWLVKPSQTGFSPARLPALRLGAQFRFISYAVCFCGVKELFMFYIVTTQSTGESLMSLVFKYGGQR